jgi:hypothetical protein
MSGKLHDIAEKEGIEIISYKDIWKSRVFIRC